MRHLLGLLYIVILLVLGAATFVEQAHGTAFAAQHIYHALWFVGLWAALTAAAVVVIVRRRLWQRKAAALLHLALLTILAGAATTFFTSQSGMMHIREGQTENMFIDQERHAMVILPFSLRLDSFRVSYYPGTETPTDYQSFVTLDNGQAAVIAMNNILSHEGYRLYQSSYDPDQHGTILTVRYDPIGTRLTYAGYLLLAVGMIGVLCTKRGRFRQLLRQVMASRAAVLCAAFVLGGGTVQARSLPTVNAEKAEAMARQQIVYNGRIVPFSTMAHDFMLKIYGRTDYHGLSAEQVVCGWMARPEVWKNEPIIKVKDGQLRRQLGADDKYMTLQSLFNADGTYKVAALMEADGLPAKPVQQLDEQVGIIIMLTQGTLFAPLPADAPRLTTTRVEAEILYNRLPLVKVLFMLNLTLGLLSLLLFILGLADRRHVRRPLATLFALSLLALSFLYVLRWYVSGHVPMGNGYETMLFMSLVIMAISALLGHHFPLVRCLGLLLSGFTLLVAHLGDSNPQITHLMPVLNSPLLSLHVSIIMMAYALLGMTAIIAAVHFILRSLRPRPAVTRQLHLLTPLSQLLLYPAVFFLSAGIFIGAVWANISWGTYWSWDPKEVWALITLLLYVVPLHPSLTGQLLATPTRYHLFMLCAFMAVLMTYFGVNYFLGGMHSYA